MALTVTERGSGGNNTAATTLVINPGSNFAVNSLGVLTVSVDNAGSGGATAIAPASITDSKGNTWTRRVTAIQDPGAASAGVEIAIYTARIATALLTTDNITITWGGSTSPTAKRWALKEVAAGSGNRADYVTGGNNTGASTGTPTVTTSSIPSGDVVVGMGGAESADTWAGDADTSNGSWSTHIHGASGTGTSGMSLTTQHKVVTGAGTQTYNPTLTAADVILGWIQVTETILQVLPAVLSQLAGVTAPSSVNQQVSPALISQIMSQLNPSVNVAGGGGLSTPVHLGAARDTSNITDGSYTGVTPSRAFTSTELAVVFVSITGTAPPDVASLSGGGITWTKEGTGDQRGNQRFYVFYGVGPGDGSNLVVAVGGGFAVTGMLMDIVAVPGADLTTKFQQAIVYGDVGASPSLTLTLGSAVTAGNYILFGIVISNAEDTTWDAGTELNDATMASPSVAQSVGYDDTSPPQSVTATPATNASMAGAIIEVKASAGGGGAQSVSPALLSQLVSDIAPQLNQQVVASLISQLVTPTAPTINQRVALGLLSQLVSAVAPTITPGNVNVLPGLISQLVAATAFSRIDQKLTMGLINQLVSTLAPAVRQQVAVGLLSQLVSPVAPSLTAVASVSPGLITQLASPTTPQVNQQVVVGLISQLASVAAPSLIQQQFVSPGLLSQLVSNPAPTFIQAQFVSPGAISEPASVNAPQVNQQVPMGLISEPITPTAPTLTQVQQVLLDVISELVTPQAFDQILQTLTPALITQAIAPNSPEINQQVAVDVISELVTVLNATITIPGATVFADTISQPISPIAPTQVTQQLTMGLINEFASVVAPNVVPNQEVDMSLISELAAAIAPSKVAAAVTPAQLQQLASAIAPQVNELVSVSTINQLTSPVTPTFRFRIDLGRIDQLAVVIAPELTSISAVRPDPLSQPASTIAPLLAQASQVDPELLEQLANAPAPSIFFGALNREPRETVPERPMRSVADQMVSDRLETRVVERMTPS